MPLAEKGVRGKGRQPLSPPQHTEIRSAKRFCCRSLPRARALIAVVRLMRSLNPRLDVQRR